MQKLEDELESRLIFLSKIKMSEKENLNYGFGLNVYGDIFRCRKSVDEIRSITDAWQCLDFCNSVEKNIRLAHESQKKRLTAKI